MSRRPARNASWIRIAAFALPLLIAPPAAASVSWAGHPGRPAPRGHHAPAVRHGERTAVWKDALEGVSVPDGAEAPNGADSAMSACSDSAYATSSGTWVDTLKWWFNNKSTPSGLDQSSAKSALRDGAKAVTQAKNDCGLPDDISNKSAYQGTTSTSVNINTDASCGKSDGKSVVGFGTLPSSVLALTCWWTDSKGHTTEADVRLNKASYAWVASVPKGCTKSFMIAAAATHEFGHAFGLAHVSEASHANLTMSPTIMACQDGEATLGLGDLKGFESKY